MSHLDIVIIGESQSLISSDSQIGLGLTRGFPSDQRKSPSMVLSFSPIHWYSLYLSQSEKVQDNEIKGRKRKNKIKYISKGVRVMSIKLERVKNETGKRRFNPLFYDSLIMAVGQRWNPAA